VLTRFPEALTLALSQGEREPEGWISSPRPLGEGLEVRGIDFCHSIRDYPVVFLKTIYYEKNSSRSNQFLQFKYLNNFVDIKRLKIV